MHIEKAMETETIAKANGALPFTSASIVLLAAKHIHFHYLSK